MATTTSNAYYTSGGLDFGLFGCIGEASSGRLQKTSFAGRNKDQAHNHQCTLAPDSEASPCPRRNGLGTCCIIHPHHTGTARTQQHPTPTQGTQELQATLDRKSVV